MALQDLTPQLRTRLSRLERLVGLFVSVALILLLAGLAYYVYRVAERKGWFVRKLPYFTFVDSASGLREGDPIKMMGFDVGEITEITPQPPFDTYNVYVAFVVKEDRVGYLWDDSRARVASSDFLGKRAIELSKGTNGPPTYLFHAFRSVSLSDAQALLDSTNWFFAQSVYDASGTNVLARSYQPLTRDRWLRLSSRGVERFQVFDKSAPTKWPAGIWDYQEGRYQPFERRTSKGFYLPPHEEPALTARLEKVADIVESALPNVLGLTNQVNRALEQAGSTARNADVVLEEIRPILRHLLQISGQLTNGQGALGEWLLPSELRRQLGLSMASADRLFQRSDQEIGVVSTNLTVVLVHLASVTSNLNAQVVANSNILAEISSAVTNTDRLVQGLKKHWLLRSAFKEPKNADRPKPAPASGSGKK